MSEISGVVKVYKSGEYKRGEIEILNLPVHEEKECGYKEDGFYCKASNAFEVAIHAQLWNDFPDIVLQPYAFTKNDGNIYLRTPFCGKSLNDKYKDSDVKTFISYVVKALEILIRLGPNFIHGDFWSENIMIDDDATVRLIDFEFSSYNNGRVQFDYDGNDDYNDNDCDDYDYNYNYGDDTGVMVENIIHMSKYEEVENEDIVEFIQNVLGKSLFNDKKKRLYRIQNRMEALHECIQLFKCME